MVRIKLSLRKVFIKEIHLGALDLRWLSIACSNGCLIEASKIVGMTMIGEQQKLTLMTFPQQPHSIIR
jgi:hypothetical protein